MTQRRQREGDDGDGDGEGEGTEGAEGAEGGEQEDEVEDRLEGGEVGFTAIATDGDGLLWWVSPGMSIASAGFDIRTE